MKSHIILLVVLISYNTIFAQNTLKATIKDAATHEPLPYATAVVKGTSNGALANDNGELTIQNIPNGEQTIEFSFTGYETQQQQFTFPLAGSDTINLFLKPSAYQLGTIVVSSTRSNRSIANIPTRIEFIGLEEIEENGNMNPGDIRMLLNESTGIQVQQTSATSANASIRIQGLDGRYTLILKDEFPLYSGAASGLGLLQTPPLDLKQVEIIKGSSSTLHGGGAIAGLINLISKTPTDKRELSFQLNGTSALGWDVIGFYSQKVKKVGWTLFASHNNSAAYDPANIGLSAIPKVERYNINPRLFLYCNNKTKADFGVNTTFENRLGGDMLYIQGKGDQEHSFFERNKTNRVSTQFSLEHTFSDKLKMNVRNSYNHFERTVTIPDYIFDGVQNSTFNEINYSYSGENTEWVTGVNLWTDVFKEKQISENLRNYNQLTSGVFVQNLSKVTDWFSLESGLRGDYVVDYGFAFLPRLAALFKINQKWTSRIGGGLGYKTPTIFTEESERIQFQNVLPINSDSNKLERSYGANADVNYRTMLFDKITFSINQLFFYTYLNNPLMLISQNNGNYQFQNIDGHIDSKGAETNVKIGYDDFKLYLGYTLTDAVVHKNGTRYQNPLTPKHTVSAVLMYEEDDTWRIGIEAYYTSKQSLSDGTTGRSYWLLGAMIEKIWEHFSIYANCENLTDTRQTRFGSIYTGSITNPVFKDIYAPLDGFVVNAGIKIKL
ncbi:MAG: TonB-dependent receptor [Bacteroidetes bacterium]|nr:TonB-dependent receptor [Bacteroidota bacterium]